MADAGRRLPASLAIAILSAGCDGSASPSRAAPAARAELARRGQAGDRRRFGGYGAMEYAARQPGLFRFAGSYSGGGFREFVGPASGPEPYDKWGNPVAQADVWKTHDPYLNAAALRGTALFLSYGNGQLGALDDATATFDATEEY
jgi:hypothetical protein